MPRSGPLNALLSFLSPFWRCDLVNPRLIFPYRAVVREQEAAAPLQVTRMITGRFLSWGIRLAKNLEPKAINQKYVSFVQASRLLSVYLRFSALGGVGYGGDLRRWRWRLPRTYWVDNKLSNVYDVRRIWHSIKRLGINASTMILQEYLIWLEPRTKSSEHRSRWTSHQCSTLILRGVPTLGYT